MGCFSSKIVSPNVPKVANTDTLTSHGDPVISSVPPCSSPPVSSEAVKGELDGGSEEVSRGAQVLDEVSPNNLIPHISSVANPVKEKLEPLASTAQLSDKIPNDSLKYSEDCVKDVEKLGDAIIASGTQVEMLKSATTAEADVNAPEPEIKHGKEEPASECEDDRMTGPLHDDSEKLLDVKPKLEVSTCGGIWGLGFLAACMTPRKQ